MEGNWEQGKANKADLRQGRCLWEGGGGTGGTQNTRSIGEQEEDQHTKGWCDKMKLEITDRNKNHEHVINNVMRLNHHPHRLC